MNMLGTIHSSANGASLSHIERRNGMSPEKRFAAVKQIDDLLKQNVISADDLKKSIIFLLERQNPELINNLRQSDYIIGMWNGNCPSCGELVSFGQNIRFHYCPKCGKRLKWPERVCKAERGEAG